MDQYLLIGQTVVAEPDLLKWALEFEQLDRRVARTDFPGGFVSTVFLGLDHNFCMSGPPVLFETMVFFEDGGWGDQERCSTWLEAEAQHQRMVEKVLEQIKRR